MRILKQRLKRVVVFLLALTLLLQPLTAYAYVYEKNNATDASPWVQNDGKYVGTISSIEERNLQELPAGAILLVDFYNPTDNPHNAIFNGYLCDALFYVKEPDADYLSVVNTTEGVTDEKPSPTAMRKDVIFKLGEMYDNKKVEKWNIISIKDSGQQGFYDGKSMQEGGPDYDPTDYTYKISYDMGQTKEDKVFEGYTTGSYNYERYIHYWLIQVEPVYEDSGEPEEPKTAKVTFDPNGGTLTDPASSPREMAKGDAYVELPETTRPYYDFLGWFTTLDGDTKIEEGDIKGDNENEILYAHWEEWTYNIQFNANGGTGTMSDIMLRFSEDGTAPGNGFSRDGFTFLGWSRNPDASSANYNQGDSIPRETTDKGGTDILYAIWKEDFALNKPTVTFNPNGGILTDPDSRTREVAKGEAYGDLPETTRAGYEFLGWFTEQEDNNGEPITATSTKTTEGDETLYAHWREFEYTIKFDANGGTGKMQPMTLKYSEEKPLTKNTFTREGYTFLGWSQDKNTTTDLYRDEQEVHGLSAEDNAEVTLYAVWQDDNSGTPPPVSGTPKVTFNPNGGSDCKPFSEKEVAQGNQYGDLPTTTRAHYEFEGWFTEKEGGTEITAVSIKATNTDETLYAHWEEYQYTIKFNANGGEGVMDDMTLKYSQKAALTKNAFTRSGYQFKGWNTDKDAVLAKYKDRAQVQSLTGDNKGVVTLYAVWQKPSKETPPKEDPPKKTPDSSGGGDNTQLQSEIVRTYAAQNIENVKTSDSMHIYRYIIMLVSGAGLILVSVGIRKKRFP